MKALTPLLTAGALAGAAVMTARRTPDDLRGEVAIVTGASRGLGLLLARELARQGCPLVICARDAAELDRAAAQLREAGAGVTAVAFDVTDEATPSRLIQAALERHGRLDIVISDAGIIQVGPVRAASPEHFETALDTMALAPARLALAALPVMRGRGHGRIVTIASIGGKLSVPHLLPYSTAKFAAVGFSEGLRAELGRGPVTVTTVVRPESFADHYSQARQFFVSQDEVERRHIIDAFVFELSKCDSEAIRTRMVAGLRNVGDDLAGAVAEGLGLPGLPSATVRMSLTRCSAPDREHLEDAQQIRHPGYRRLGIQQRHASRPGPDLHGRHHQRRHRRRIGVAQVRCVDCQLHRLPGYLGGECLVQPRNGGDVRFTGEDQDGAGRPGSDRYLQRAHGHPV